MRSVLLGVSAAVLLVGCGGKEKGTDARVRSVGALHARLETNPDPPRVGHDSGFAVILTENNAPVTGARVNLALFYKSMNQPGPTASCTETAPGRYEATELSTGMNGKWEAAVTVSRQSQPDARLDIPFSVAK